MLVESIALIAVIFAMAFTFLRANMRDYAIGVLPLLMLPAVNIGLSYIVGFFSGLFNVSRDSVAVCTILVALVITCIIIGACGMNFRKKTHRSIYFIISGLFAIILSMLFILNALK